MYILQIRAGIASIFDDMSEGLKKQVKHEKDERQKDSVRHSYE
jgi:hypothetical protein